MKELGKREQKKPGDERGGGRKNLQVLEEEEREGEDLVHDDGAR